MHPICTPYASLIIPPMIPISTIQHLRLMICPAAMGRPTMRFSRVVFPAPEGPIKATTSPDCTKPLTSSRSFRPPGGKMSKGFKRPLQARQPAMIPWKSNVHESTVYSILYTVISVYQYIYICIYINIYISMSSISQTPSPHYVICPNMSGIAPVIPYRSGRLFGRHPLSSAACPPPLTCLQL